MVLKSLKLEPKIRLQYIGVFDFDGLYKYLYSLLEADGYEIEENAYKHKVPTALGAWQEIKWSAWRKIDEYVRYWIQIDFFLFDVHDVEVMKDGKKVRMTEGKLRIEFHGRVEADWQGRFDGKVMEYLQGFYHKFVVKKKMEGGYWDELFYKAVKIHNLTKIYLGMETISHAYDKQV